LEDLLFVGNPLEEKHTADGDWRKQVTSRLKGLKKLDGK
jgi:dynein light chain 1